MAVFSCQATYKPDSVENDHLSSYAIAYEVERFIGLLADNHHPFGVETDLLAANRVYLLIMSP
jgi:hypothetical protein